MSTASFEKLVGLLDLDVDGQKSRNSTGGIDPIEKRIVVACGLRYLGGECHKSIADIFHISIPSSKRVVNRFIDAVIECPELSIHLPSEEDLEGLANGWNSKSTADKVLHGCVLALDGFLSSRTTPSVSNAADYFTSHKMIHALNVQAACDHLLPFRFVCVCGPGKLNDGRAYRRCKRFRQWIQALPDRYYVAADNAYPLSNKTLIPFKGSQKNQVYNSSFNFYLSQMRIRIEMAFGRMTTKFRIMRNKLNCSLETQSRPSPDYTTMLLTTMDYQKDSSCLPGSIKMISCIPRSWSHWESTLLGTTIRVITDSLRPFHTKLTKDRRHRQGGQQW